VVGGFVAKKWRGRGVPVECHVDGEGVQSGGHGAHSVGAGSAEWVAVVPAWRQVRWPNHGAGCLNPFKSVNAIQMDLNSKQTSSNFI
jgi:hypothetical protein